MSLTDLVSILFGAIAFSMLLLFLGFKLFFYDFNLIGGLICVILCLAIVGISVFILFYKCVPL